MTDPGLRTVFGPLAVPLRTGGPGPYRCGCRADLGASCAHCDGTEQEISEYFRASREQRRAYTAGMAAWWLAPHAHTRRNPA